MKSHDQRNFKRHTFTTSSVAIAPDGAREDCCFVDISHKGARLQADNPAHIPDQFMLVLSERWKIFRQCTASSSGRGLISLPLPETRR
jgi:hypothetical protein